MANGFNSGNRRILDQSYTNIFTGNNKSEQNNRISGMQISMISRNKPNIGEEKISG
jgi:hypothetical protein